MAIESTIDNNVGQQGTRVGAETTHATNNTLLHTLSATEKCVIPVIGDE